MKFLKTAGASFLSVALAGFVVSVIEYYRQDKWFKRAGRLE